MKNVNPKTGTAAEMPRYRCHKEVHALKIKAFYPTPTEGTNEWDGTYVVEPEDEGFSQFHVDQTWIKKHEPKPGGYFVVYKDGYTSFSPAEAFDEGYTRI